MALAGWMALLPLSAWLVLGGAALAVACYTLFRVHTSGWRKLPGRAPAFPLGSLAGWDDLLKVNREILADCDERGWVTQWVGWQRSVAPVRADLVQKVLHSSVQRTMKPWILNYAGLFHIAKFMGQESVGHSEGDVWVKDRQAIAGSLRPMYFRTLLGDIIGYVDKFAAVWLPGGKSETILDVAPSLEHLTLDVVCNAVLGEGIGALDALERGGHEPVFDAFRFASDEMVRRTSSANPLDWMYWLGPFRPVQRKLDRARSVLLNRVQRVVEARLQRGNTQKQEGDRDFLDHLLQSGAGEMSFKGMGSGRVVDNLVTMMWAGHDTTAATLSFALYELSRRKDLQDEMRREMRDVLQGGELTMDQLGDMRILDAVIWETLRMYSPALWTNRGIVKEVDCGDGLVLKKNSMALVPVWAVHHSPLNWDHPDEFRPSRFLGDGESAAEARHRCALIPFGGGRRICPGNQLAPFEAKSCLALLVERFEFLAPADAEEPTMDAHGMFRQCMNNRLRVRALHPPDGDLAAHAQQA